MLGLGFDRTTTQLGASSKTGFVDTAKCPIAATFFFFFFAFGANAK